jgi:tetratricopeptide (TPR) repeat protein
MVVHRPTSAPKAFPDVDHTPRVFLMENHDEAYHIWRDAGVRQRILVHIDAHDDLWWIDDPESTNIANFICPALREDLVKEVYWVVPDQTWDTPKTLKPVLRRLEKILKTYPGDSRLVSVESRQISAYILGKPFHICLLSSLPAFQENVLLDIDVDFLIIPRACQGGEEPVLLPWCWPDELVAGINSRLRAHLVTIAYSVEGGYTPLKWKYLGDELALRLNSDSDNHGKIRGLESMRAGVLGTYRGNFGAAEENYQAARELLPGAATPLYHLAQLYLKMARNDQAVELYRTALALDSSYRTAYNNDGPWFLAAGRLREAEAEYRRTLALDPEDAYAHLGLGRVASRGKRWTEAEGWLRKSLELNGQLIDSYRVLGKVLAKQKRRREAIAAYEKSLLLALKGHKPLTEVISTDYQGLLDPDHFRIHGRLARLYDLEGETERAISGYRMSIAKGGDSFFPRSRLAHLYLKQRRWRQSALEALQAIKKIPLEVKIAARRAAKAGRRLRRSIKIGYRSLFRREVK